MIEDGRDAPRRGDRPRHRVVPQRPLAGLQDRRSASTPRCARSSSRSRRRSPRWASPSGRWSSSRPTMRSHPRHGSPARTTASTRCCIWTPDKDLAQCVRGDRVVQIDRRAQSVRNADGVREKFGVEPGADPRLPRARRRLGGRLSGHSRNRRRHGRPAREPSTARSRTSRPRCSVSAASLRCCSRTWRRSEPMPTSSRPPTTSGGAGRRAPGPHAPSISETTACSRGAARPTQRDAPPCLVSGAVCDGLRSGERGHVGEDGGQGERSLARGWARHRHLHPRRAAHVLP